MACDPNYVDNLRQANAYKGPYSMFERCMYNTSQSRLVIKYAD